MKKRRDAGRPRGAPIRSAVLRAVRLELAESGFDGLKIDNVAKRCEVNKTSIYRRWPTREALVAAALEGVLDEVGSALKPTGSLRDDFHCLLQAVARLLVTPEGQALLQAALASSTTEAISRMATKQLARRAAGPARSMVENAMRRGEWRPEASPQRVLSILVGALLHRVLLEKATPSPDWLRSIADLVCDGVMPRTA